MANIKDDTDEALLKQLRAGSKPAFEEIFNRYWYALYKIVYVRIQKHEEAEEIVQELFATLWQRRKALRIERLADYLFTAARHRTISYIRACMVRDAYQKDFKEDALTTETEEAVSFNELAHVIERVISTLPEKSQQVFRLNRMEGRPVSEVAKFLNMPRRTAEYHLTKSLRALRMHLKDFILIPLFVLLFG